MSVRTVPAWWQVCRMPTAILAGGTFPTHPVPLDALHAAGRIVCCDGAAAGLVAAGLEPAAIAGDLDSLPDDLQRRFADRLHRDPGQDDNDLAKAFRFCRAQGWDQIAILGATGRREDHTLGNLGWLPAFAAEAEVALLTDAGVFCAVTGAAVCASFAGQPVSVFTFDGRTALRGRGLRYPLDGLRPSRWWEATLNEALGDSFEVAADGGPTLVFQAYPA